jgi:hypothetical protein
MAKECIEKNRSDDLKAITKRAEQRETELNIMIDTLEAKTGMQNGFIVFWCFFSSHFC